MWREIKRYFGAEGVDWRSLVLYAVVSLTVAVLLSLVWPRIGWEIRLLIAVFAAGLLMKAGSVVKGHVQRRR